MTMIKEPSDFPNGHCQDDHFDHDHNTTFIIKWSWSNGQNQQMFQQFQKISTISTTKSLELELTILTIEPQFGLIVENLGHRTPLINSRTLSESFIIIPYIARTI
jgi:hypothetical protein